MLNKKNKYNLILGGIILIFPIIFLWIIEFYHHLLNWQETTSFFSQHFSYSLFSYLVILVLTLFVISLIGDVIIGESISAILIIGISFASSQKMIARNTPLYPEEITMISELKLLITMIDFNSFILLVGVIILILGVSIAVSIFIKKKLKLEKNRKVSWSIRLVTLLVSSLLLYGFSFSGNSTSTAAKFGGLFDINMAGSEWNQLAFYNEYGFVIGFLYNFTSDAMKQPDGYSQAEVTRIIDKYTKLAEIENATRTPIEDVNIIYIMNESFTNPIKLQDVYPLSEDPIPYTNQLLGEYTSGQTLVPDYGGGTANMEFEALTGFSNYYLSVIPYQFIIPKMNEYPSIVSYLNNQGYETTAIHPYDGRMYKRETVYDRLGFKTFIDETTLHYRHAYGSSGYSDVTAYNEAYDQLVSSNQN